MINITDIRTLIAGDIFDYQQLTDCLAGYGKPRDRIGQLLKNGEIIRIRKGLYTFPEALRRAPLCRELLANLIYGPSYVTAEYALSYYGLIPERVAVVTSITTGRSCCFETPFGKFTYQKVIEPLYPNGIVLEKSGQITFLIASPEKALVDKVWLDKSFPCRSTVALESYLRDDLRLDFEQIRNFDIKHLRNIAASYGRLKIRRLVEYLQHITEKKI